MATANNRRTFLRPQVLFERDCPGVRGAAVAIAQDPHLHSKIQVRKNIAKKPQGQLGNAPGVTCSYPPQPEIAFLTALRAVQQLDIILPDYAVEGLLRTSWKAW